MNFISALLAPFFALGALFASSITPPVVAPLGASQPIPTTIAFFETTLAAAITDSATSFTLTSATDKDGTTLASSTYAFVIDEGSSNEEIVIADCTSTACTNALRGVSVRTGNTEVTALKKAHRRGASIKITDAPVLPLISRVLRGEGTVSFTPSENYSLVTKTYVDALALGTTTVSATESDDGIVELATGLEAASSTALGGSGSSLALSTLIATSSPYTTGYMVPVTGVNGKLSNSFFALATTTTIGDLPAYYIGKNIQVITTTGTSTFSVPSGVTKIKVELVGAGGKGGDSSSSARSASGGGAGGYAMKFVDVTGTSTIQVYVASSTASTTGETTKFGTNGYYFYATGGSPGADQYVGGVGGCGYLGDVNICGGDGHSAIAEGAGGNGGASYFGGGGYGAANPGSTKGKAYGSGGGGGISGSTGGSNGAQGIIIITW